MSQADVLWRRAGLGTALRPGLDAAGVRDFLVGYANEPDPLPGPPPLPRIPPGVLPTVLLLGESARWWIGRMAVTQRPLEEWLTLFWHRHFATSAAKVFSPGLMLAQNQTLRTQGGGRFGDLLKALLRDPAMLIWLDLQDNRAGAPNENFARELLELFTVGRGEYSEPDVKALARVLTGWRLSLPGLQAQFDVRRHDAGPARVLELTGELPADRVLDYLAVHPATARRLTGRLWEALAGEPLPPGSEWPALWRRCHGDVLTVVRAMLGSPALLAAPGRVQSPLELYVAALRTLDVRDIGLAQVHRLFALGEVPFLPPSVKGWRQGLEWIHPLGLLDRFALMEDLVARASLESFEGLAVERRADAVAERLRCWPLAAATRRELATHAGSVRRLWTLALCAPDLQVA